MTYRKFFYSLDLVQGENDNRSRISKKEGTRYYIIKQIICLLPIQSLRWNKALPIIFSSNPAGPLIFLWLKLNFLIIIKIYVCEQKFIHVIAWVFFFRISQNRRLLISVPWEEKGSKIKTLRFEKICMLSHESILDKTKIKIWNKFVHVFFPQIFDSEICENG